MVMLCFRVDSLTFVTVKSTVGFFHRLLRLLAKQLMECAEILCVCMSLLSNGLPVKSVIK